MVFFLCSFFFDIVQLFKLGPSQSVCIAEASGAGTGKEVRSFILFKLCSFFLLYAVKGDLFFYSCLISLV